MIRFVRGPSLYASLSRSLSASLPVILISIFGHPGGEAHAKFTRRHMHSSKTCRRLSEAQASCVVELPIAREAIHTVPEVE